MEAFSRKLKMQKDQILEGTKQIVVREGDRVISAVTAGPHDRILDPDIHDFWKSMGWKGNAKARHFILALRDRYHERDETSKDVESQDEGMDSDPEGWTLQFINPASLQPILEAFDDDASGFITVAEVNKFTAARPQGWSLSRWIAYWAVGLQMTVYDETEKISDIFRTMFGTLPRLLNQNRASAYQYLQSVWESVYGIVGSVEVTPVSRAWSVQGRFKEYEEAEERRLKTNLEAIQYYFDELDALSLVTGPGRIEKHFFVLIRLLLSRHLDAFRIGHTETLDEQELTDAAATIHCVMRAVELRYQDLKITFIRQRVDLTQQFKSFACGFFGCLHDPKQLWSPDRVRAMRFWDYGLEDDSLETRPDPKLVLKYCLEDPNLINYPQYDENNKTDGFPIPNSDSHVASTRDTLLGTWNWTESIQPTTFAGSAGFMQEITLTAVPTTNDRFEGCGRDYVGNRISVSGSCAKNEDNTIRVSFTVAVFTDRRREYQPGETTGTWYYVGQLDAEATSIIGTWGMVKEDSSGYPGEFSFRRTAAEVLCFRPPQPVFNENKARALWTYACQAVRDQICRQKWSWSFFRERRDLRKRL